MIRKQSAGMMTNPRFNGADMNYKINRKKYDERWQKIACHHEEILKLIDSDMGLEMIGRTFNFRWQQWRQELLGLSGIEEALIRRQKKQIRYLAE